MVTSSTYSHRGQGNEPGLGDTHQAGPETENNVTYSTDPRSILEGQLGQQKAGLGTVQVTAYACFIQAYPFIKEK